MLNKKPNTDVKANPKNLKNIASWIILSIFGIQSFVRLFYIVIYKGETLAILHLLTILFITSIVILCFLKCINNKIMMACICIFLSFFNLFLLSYDMLDPLSAKFGSTFFSYGYLVDMYCSTKFDYICLQQNYQFFVLVTIIIIISTLILFSLRYSLHSCIVFLLLPLNKIPGPKWLNSTVLLLFICGSYPLFRGFSDYRWSGEALHSLFLSQFELGPAELLTRTAMNPNPPRSGVVTRRPLIVISIDSLRGDFVEVGAGRPTLTPFLRSLNEEGVLHKIEPAYSICTVSYCGILGMLLSNSWADMHDRPSPALTDVLAGYGYKNYLILSGEHERFANIKKFYGPNLTHFSDNRASDDFEMVRRLSKLKFDQPSQTFVFMHLMSAHIMGKRYHETAMQLREVGNIPKDFKTQVPDEVFARHYSRGVTQADEVVRRIFGILERKKLLDDAVIVITADHGERLGDYGTIGHNGVPDLAVSNIALLIYDRKYRPTSSLIASQIDVAPTILKAINAPVPREWTGMPLQQVNNRAGVPVDSRTTTGVVFLNSARVMMYRCDRQSGQEQILTRKDGIDVILTDPELLVEGRLQHNMLVNARDLGNCK